MVPQPVERLAFLFYRLRFLTEAQGGARFVGPEFLDAARDITGVLRETGVLGRGELAEPLRRLQTAEDFGGVDPEAAQRFIGALAHRGLYLTPQEDPRTAAERLALITGPAMPGRPLDPLGRLGTLFRTPLTGRGGAFSKIGSLVTTLTDRIGQLREARRLAPGLAKIVEKRRYHYGIPLYDDSLEQLARLATPPPVCLLHGCSILSADSITGEGFHRYAHFVASADVTDAWLDSYVIGRETFGLAGWLELTIPFLDFLKFLAEVEPMGFEISRGRVAVEGAQSLARFNRMILRGDVLRRWVVYSRRETTEDEAETLGEKMREAVRAGRLFFGEALARIPYPVIRGRLTLREGAKEWVVARPPPAGVPLEVWSDEELVQTLIRPAGAGRDSDEAFALKVRICRILESRILREDNLHLLRLLLEAVPQDPVGFVPEVLEKFLKQNPGRREEILEALRAAVESISGEARANAVIVLLEQGHPDGLALMQRAKAEGWIDAGEAEGYLRVAREREGPSGPGDPKAG